MIGTLAIQAAFAEIDRLKELRRLETALEVEKRDEDSNHERTVDA